LSHAIPISKPCNQRRKFSQSTIILPFKTLDKKTPNPIIQKKQEIQLDFPTDFPNPCSTRDRLQRRAQSKRA
jgi:hypothetical protein